MSPAHAEQSAGDFSSPVRDCCRVRADREPAPASARIPDPRLVPIVLSGTPVADGSLRPAPRPVLATGLPLRPGPPLYTLLATLLI
jgi:hypothetical protein